MTPAEIHSPRRHKLAPIGLALAMVCGVSVGVPGRCLADPPSTSTPKVISPEALPDVSPDISTEGSTEPHAGKDELPMDTDRYQPTRISIVSARLSNTAGTLVCAADEAVKHVCEGKLNCSINVGDQLCREQKPGLLIVELLVNYRCGGPEKPHTAHIFKPLTLHISCARYLKPVS